jgi:hypothetical protein
MSEMEKEKKPEFIVTDRRKFNVDGEPRPDAPKETPAEVAAPAASAAESKSEVPPAEAVVGKAAPVGAKAEAGGAEVKGADETFVPELITETGYNGDKERISFGGQKMEFIHLLDMLVQTAMMYAGAMEGGAERRVDIVGLRQMIDLISLLEAKTKGNLTEQEQAILTNTLFQLRMTYMEIVNMIDRQAMQKAPGAGGAGRK